MDERTGKPILYAWQTTRLTNGFWGNFQNKCLNVTLPIELEQLERTGRLQSVKAEWKPGDPQKPHFFWDSDIAKWIEAVAYSLVIVFNPALEERVDRIVDDWAVLQQPDGYLNTYFTVVEPGKRFTYLKRMHELYCLGHMIEAAVAYYAATGKDKLLQIVCRYVALLSQLFGTQPGQICGYDGHEEIELALLKLYSVTRDPEHLRLAGFFLDQHGRQPSFFEQECEQRNEAVEDRKYRNDMQGMYAYYQAHQPVREQRRAVGHAVRAMYLYCAMQDYASVMNDTAMQAACDAIWENVVTRQLYITGGIGPNPVGERFTFDYDLPNAMSYNETCASIGLFLYGHRRMRQHPRGCIGDVMERALYNNILGGISLDGTTFYYANPLTVLPDAYHNMCDPRPQVTMERQKWFDVACCPPNLARLAMSLSGYLYLQRDDSLYVNLYINSKTTAVLNGEVVTLCQESRYPWEGGVALTLAMRSPVTFALALRLPEWSRSRYSVSINGTAVSDTTVADGFVVLKREWHDGDAILWTMDVRARLTEANPNVAEDCGRVVLERGPLVYCLEECDNGTRLSDLVLDPDTLVEKPFQPELLGGIVPLAAVAERREAWAQNRLYNEWSPHRKEVPLTAVPFYARYNRAPGEMIVWVQCRDMKRR